ncbi:MAG: 30S ribosome-binding factor RbfA [Blastocatellia bacterium]
MQFRRDRLAGQIRVEISAILSRELRDQIEGLVTVTEVELTPDLREARILVSLFGSPEQKSATLTALNASVGAVRRMIGSRIRLRHTPDLLFVVDRTIEDGDRMVSLLEEVGREQRQD